MKKILTMLHSYDIEIRKLGAIMLAKSYTSEEIIDFIIQNGDVTETRPNIVIGNKVIGNGQGCCFHDDMVESTKIYLRKDQYLIYVGHCTSIFNGNHNNRIQILEY